MSKGGRNRQGRNKPRTQTVPFDLDAREKQIQAEEGAPFKFTYGGNEYALPPVNKLDRAMLREALEGDQEVAFREAMSPEEWKVFRDEPLSIDGMNALFEEWAEHSGIDTGK